MTPIELLLSPIYILLLHLYFKWRRNKLQNDILKKYHRQAFRIKILAVFLFVLYYTYLTGGDTRSLYFAEGRNLYRYLVYHGDGWSYLFRKDIQFDELKIFDPRNYGYLLGSANYLTIKITAILCFLTFGQYLLINLLCGCFAFTGLWKLFMFFYQQRPQIHKALAISILFFPSVVFWSAGLMKDTLCIGALGWLTYSLYNFTRGKEVLKNAIIIFLSVYLLAVLKVYILLAYAPFLLLYILLDKLGAVKATLFKYMLTTGILFSVAFVFSQAYSSFEDEFGAFAVDNLTATMTNYTENFTYFNNKEIAESGFSLGAEYDGTFVGLAKIAPFAITATFFRPFIWETRKISQLMAAVESIILMLFTLKMLIQTGPVRFVRFILSDSMIIFCMTFALIFGLFVGTTTLNFGTLVRYKIPCLPFYAISLVLINQKIRDRAAKRKAMFERQLAAASVGKEPTVEQ